MSIIELIFLAAGLSMDAFAVSVCKGLAMKKISIKKMSIVGTWFGGFQALMPLIGYILGSAFESYIKSFDHWIAFILLALIGANMIKESLSSDDEKENDSLDFKTMLLLAIATSIDALAVGITFALLPNVNIIAAILFIGIFTFATSAAGVKIGNVFGIKYKSKAEFAGGFILMAIGAKILLEHLGLIGF